MKKLIVTAGIGVVVASALTVGSPAGADDQRPCVSQVEYRSAPGTHVASVRRQTRLDRRELERFWDVKGLGRIDPELTDARSTFWEYPACGYSLAEAQVWVVTRGRNGIGLATFRWVAGGAVSHGHV